MKYPLHSVIANKRIGKYCLVELVIASPPGKLQCLEVSVYTTPESGDISPWDHGVGYDYDREQYEDPNEAIFAYLKCIVNMPR